ncbi:penicillin-binding protein [Microlunatus phosphovorus NM-1]|uniref:Penicillin-binding protein n=1 Tax=Microlunatus phosphovorus (strain ATCC 700054 / DSM 10555 / JCM 9379 / NBRC 101784 / NCIMB 13414 / VKM Ac-1990 / NM-1) TaxID=1032480 RepID=F5XGA2_MICPN|nr:transglycosylase domain-containing protein [Microlunatus phosphovorus]BAK38036.1 penicillin-binding protein [Microlunatus phosphovorus NM-1]
MPFTPKRVGGVAYSLVMFIVVSVLSGVLIAGLFVPIAGLAGVSSKAAAEELGNLPAELETPIPPTRSKVLMGNGKVLAYFYDENRIYVKLDKIAPVMRQAQLAIEDHRFYEHGALDLRGTMRALVRNSAGGETQGGSSISQQYVKMVQIEACQGDRECIADAQRSSGPEGYKRKIRELRYAIALEKRFSKDQILERYLNIAYYGEGAYGVEAAARHYFSKNASELNLSEAALLAGLVQNPDANNPVDNPGAASDRRDVVLNRMASPELKLITPQQAAAAKKQKFNPKKVKHTRAGCVGTKYPFLCDYVYQTLKTMPSLGKTVKDRENLVKRGGLTIQTAIDPKTQDAAEKAVAKVVGPTDPLISTMNMIQPGTGLILAMAQSRPVMGTDTKKGESYWNYAVDPKMGGTQGYQAGSTFKAFTAAAALERGIPLSKRFNARASMEFGGKSFETCNGREQVYGRWNVKNSTGANGNMNMYRGAQMSVNTYFVQLEMTTGMCRVTKMAKKLGLKLGTTDRDIVKYYQHTPSFTLGSVEVSPLSMTEAYATFAARGIHCDPIIIESVTTRTKKKLEVPDGNCKRVMSKDVADGMNKLLASVITKGTGTRARTSDGRPQAGKTGTIDSNEAVWFAGYTPDVAGVAMISIDNRKKPFIKSKKAKATGQFRRQGVKYYRVPSTGVYLEGSGGGDAGQKIWKPTMEKYLDGVPRTSFKSPPSRIERGKIVTVPSSFGLGIDAYSKKLRKAGFTVETSRVYSDRTPRGGFVGWSPGPGARVGQYSTIYRMYSMGRDPAKVAAERAAKKRAEAAKKAAAKKKAAEEKKKKAEKDDG